MLSVTKIVKFGAAHFLPNYDGDCKNLHGHTWKVEVEVADKNQLRSSYPETGMLLDFKDLKALLNVAILERYDHQLLNDRLDNPTAENLVYDILANMDAQIKAMNYNLELIKIKVWESDTSFATWRRVG